MYNNSDITAGVRNISKNLVRAGGKVDIAVFLGAEDARRERVETQDEEICPDCGRKGIRNMSYHKNNTCPKQHPKG